jgi:hypothetical protein
LCSLYKNNQLFGGFLFKHKVLQGEMLHPKLSP